MLSTGVNKDVICKLTVVVAEKIEQK